MERVDDCLSSFPRYFDREVGHDYVWTDRAERSDQRWRERLTMPGVSLWILYVGGVPAGFCELHAAADRCTEIAPFGLRPEFTGRGLGSALLAATSSSACPSRLLSPSLAPSPGGGGRGGRLRLQRGSRGDRGAPGDR